MNRLSRSQCRLDGVQGHNRRGLALEGTERALHRPSDGWEGSILRLRAATTRDRRAEEIATASPCEGSALGGLLDCRADAGDSADGGEDSSASVTPAGSRPGDSEVPRFDRKVMV